MDATPTKDLGGWVHDHIQKLTYTYDLARKKMRTAAAQLKQRYDRKAHATPCCFYHLGCMYF